MRKLNVADVVFVKPIIRVRGGVSFTKTGETEENIGVRNEKSWYTKRTIAHVEEKEKADKLRQRGIYNVGRFCANTEIGWLCPRDRIGAVKEAIEDTKRAAMEHNSTAKHTRVTVYCLYLEIQADKDSIERSMRDEILDTLDGIREAITQADYKEIRYRLKGLKNFDSVLESDIGRKLKTAVASVRETANLISRKSDEIETIKDQISTEPIDSLRFAIIESETEEEKTEEPEPVAIEPRTFEPMDVVEPMDVDPEEIQSASSRNVEYQE